MKVRMKANYASPTASYTEGQTAEFDAATAAELIQGGYADPIATPARAAAESATKAGPRETRKRPNRG